MKTTESTSGVLLSGAVEVSTNVPTPEPPTAELGARRATPAAQTPIAVTDGDFSTPTRRTRTVTRPRGLKTLASLGLDGSTPSASSSAPDSQVTPAPPAAAARPGSADEFTPPPDGRAPETHRSSAVDEFLAALPTPVPEVGSVTPPPEVPLLAAPPEEAPPGKDWAAPSEYSWPDAVAVASSPLAAAAPSVVENAGSAAELRRAALAAASAEIAPARTHEPSGKGDPDPRGGEGTGASWGSDTSAADEAPVDAPGVDASALDPAAFDPREITAIRLAQDLEQDLGAHLEGHGALFSERERAARLLDPASQGDGAGALEIEITPFHPHLVDAPPASSDAPDPPAAAREVEPELGTREPAEATTLATDTPVTLDAGTAPAGETAAEATLSPLALTLAHMAEAMQPEFGYEATDELELVEPPAGTPDGAPEAGPPIRARTNTPPPVPKHARGVAAGDRGGGLPVPTRPDARAHADVRTDLPEALAERPRRPKRSKPWFEEIFDENYLRTLPFMTPGQTLREVDFLQAALNPQPGARVLDVGCGYGRHAIELVQRGLAVTGLDLSLPLLIRAADESQRRNLVVDFVHGDMRQMAFERQFDGAYSMLTSFGYFDEESNLRVAEGIARSLKPGGRLVLDVVNRDYVVGDLPARVWWEGDGCVVLEEVEFNFNTNRLLTHRSVVFEDGRQLDQEISLRAYSLHDLGKLLRQAGFRILEVSGSIFTRGHYFGATSRNLIVLAERRAD